MPVPTITLTFADGSVLHASDLNQLVTAINQVINQSNTNASNIATKASASDIANVTATANQAISTANTANNAAYTAQNSAADAVDYALQASSVANQALEEALKRALIVQLIDTVSNVTVQSSSAISYEGIVYNKSTQRLLVKSGERYYANWANASEIGTDFSPSLGWAPKSDLLFRTPDKLMFTIGGILFQVQMTPVS